MTRLLLRNFREVPDVALSASGIRIRSADGREVIDGSGGAAVACLGHAHPAVLEAIRRQIEKVCYVHTGFYVGEPVEALAEHLVGHEPGGLTHAYFVSSGSEGVETAIKLARQYALETGQPQREHVIGRRQSYHGNTLGALGAGGNLVRRPPYAPILPQASSHVSPCYPYREQRAGEDDAAYVKRLADELEAEFQRIGPNRVMAFIAEPVVGATLGCQAALPGYFKAVREICDRHGALLILDEVMCGLGRTGTLHAWEQEGVAPDIQVIAKGLGGGYQPIGGILAAGRVVEAIRAGSGIHRHGHTYAAHPVACAAALAVQQVIHEENLVEQVAIRGRQLETALKRRLGQHPNVGDIRGRGLFWAMELVEDRETKTPFAPELGMNGRVKLATYARGLACYPVGGTIDGVRGDHVLLAPPYITTEDEIETIADLMAAGIDDAVKGLPRSAT
ncbi:aspartate aminotransferase family protein [Enterovirga rhinocerotis]|uniref:Adenosylmethionine-8-amino-7-oxononanoate aminotransferase n=1 Tax=Enterovirga rhinocerotis TaxID=1339210 RepID=A0A4R7BV24_9HYPH|nr:aspartate aminotransferase family protein [Enterovirga rhinocerotis]TDR88047.1 adenosylmethionine-8-amino-7-oxononanoate aminotransferase [Enterovirga rhinocerotis]